MNKWPCCLNKRGAPVGCSRETVFIDGEKHNLIPFGEGDMTRSYEEMVASMEEEIANGGRGRLSADDVRQQLERFKDRWDKREYNTRTCHDCGTPMGEIHHLGCDNEECPKCGEQYFVCECHTIEKEELWAEH